MTEERITRLAVDIYDDASSLELIEAHLRSLIAEVRREVLEEMSALAKFGDAVLTEARGELGDLDGGWIQDTAVKLGVLIEFEATESCGENCRCAEYGDFPMTCYRRAAIRQLAEREGER